MRVLVTGGTGSFGNAFVAMLARASLAERIVVFSRDEWKQAVMAERFAGHPEVKFFLGDVRDRDRLEDAVRGCTHVVHAAALKRVDAVAYNPSEVRRTNIEGSANVIRAAAAAGVKRVLMISSDKAVEPTNVYGVSKAQMEQEAVASNAYTWPRGTWVSVARWGNVLGSRGSVVHIFRKAIRDGKPIPVTHPDCTRFWMTLDEASSFALYCLKEMAGGEIFVPVLPSMRIVDLAEAIAPGASVDYIGLRPGGEKLHELLLSGDECRRVRWGPEEASYVVPPALHPWTKEFPWTGERKPDGFRYASDENPVRLTVEEMRTLYLPHVPEEDA